MANPSFHQICAKSAQVAEFKHWASSKELVSPLFNAGSSPRKHG